MKSFFEEYGFVILAAIVVILLIAMATPIGDLVKAQITGIVDSFANKTESKLNAVDAGAITVRATQNKGGTIKLQWNSDKKEDDFTYALCVTDSQTDGNWVKSAAGKTTAPASTYTKTAESTERSIEITGLLNNAKVEYRVYNSNDEIVASGTLKAIK